MGGIEDDGIAEGAHDRERAHIDDEIVVAEGGAALRQQDVRVASLQYLVHHVPHILRREELSLLHVDGLAGQRRLIDEIGLPAEERGNLQDVHDLGGGLRLRLGMDVGDDGNVQFLLDLRQHGKSLFEAGPAEAVEGRTVRLVKGRLENVRYAETVGYRLDFPPDVERPLQSLQHAGPRKKRQRVSRADLKIPDLDRVHNFAASSFPSIRL